MKNQAREFLGYFMGLILFVILVPLVMFWLCGGFRGEVHPGPVRVGVLAVLAVAGIGLSVWSILYMKNVGKGNPMDAFNHEVAPRTQNLMTDGPYGICRNPMLLGVFLYYLGVVICLWSWKALAVYAAYVAIMMVQVRAEEKRLREDFGEEYEEYCRTTKKLIPFVW